VARGLAAYMVPANVTTNKLASNSPDIFVALSSTRSFLR
jgi:hypothetical protein